MKYDLFLCHTGADKDWTRELGALLEEQQIGNRPIKVFFDEWDIDYGQSIITAIDEGLKESRYVGLVLSPAMVRAEWPTAEWQSQIMDDPTGRRGRILQLLLHKFDADGSPIEFPFVLKPLKRFDFTKEERFPAEFDRLLRKLADLPPLRGTPTNRRRGLGAALPAAQPSGQEAPDPMEEALTSNLLPVFDVPEWLFGDATTVEGKSEVWRKVKGTTPPFFLHANRLYSFIPPAASRNPFKPFLVGRDPRPEPVSQWLSDPDKAKQVVGMLNAALREHCYRLNLWTPKTDRGLFYPPIFESGRPRTFTWGKGKPRTIAVMKPRTKEGGGTFGVHMAARMRFILLGAKLYLLIDPAWMFTTDGVKAVEGKDMGVFSTKWGGREKNAALLRNVLMWGLLIAKGQREIRINVAADKEPVFVRLQSVPAHTRINVGIFGDKIRLDRILSGEGAGEQVGHEDPGAKELDVIANLALLGEPADDNGVGRLDDADIEDEDDQGLRLF